MSVHRNGTDLMSGCATWNRHQPGAVRHIDGEGRDLAFDRSPSDRSDQERHAPSQRDALDPNA